MVRAVTGRCREVLALTASGLTTAETAAHLHLSEHTVHAYRRSLRAYYNINTMAGVVASAFRAGDLS